MESNIIDLIYMETSAKSGENVEDAFLWCCKEILNKIQIGWYYFFLVLIERKTLGAYVHTYVIIMFDNRRN